MIANRSFRMSGFTGNCLADRDQLDQVYNSNHPIGGIDRQHADRLLAVQRIADDTNLDDYSLTFSQQSISINILYRFTHLHLSITNNNKTHTHPTRNNYRIASMKTGDFTRVIDAHYCWVFFLLINTKHIFGSASFI